MVTLPVKPVSEPADKSEVATTLPNRTGDRLASTSPPNNAPPLDLAVEATEPAALGKLTHREWVEIAITQQNMALFQAAFIPLVNDLKSMLQETLKDEATPIGSMDLPVLVDCLMVEAFEAIETHPPQLHWSEQEWLDWFAQFQSAAFSAFAKL